MSFPADAENYDLRRYALEPRGGIPDEDAHQHFSTYFERIGNSVLSRADDPDELSDVNVRHYNHMTLRYDYESSPNCGRAEGEPAMKLDIHGPAKIIDQLILQLQQDLSEIEFIDYDHWRSPKPDSSTTHDTPPPPYFPPQPE